MKIVIFGLWFLGLCPSVQAARDSKIKECLDEIQQLRQSYGTPGSSSSEATYLLNGDQIVFTEDKGFTVYSQGGVSVVNGRSCTYPVVASNDDGISIGIKRLLEPYMDRWKKKDQQGRRTMSGADNWKNLFEVCGKASPSLGAAVQSFLSVSHDSQTGSETGGTSAK